MNREQKFAWLFLVCAATGLFASVIAVFLLYPKFGMPGALKGFYMMAISGLSGPIILLLSRKEKIKEISDERDKQICKNADLAGFGAVYLLIIFVSIVPVAIAPQSAIPTQWFPFLFLSAIFCQIFARSLAILIQYGRGGNQNE